MMNIESGATDERITERYPWPHEWQGATERLGRRFVSFVAISACLIVLGALLAPFSALGWITILLALAMASANLAIYRYRTSNVRYTIAGAIVRNDRLFLRSDRQSKVFLQLASAALFLAAATAFMIAIVEDFTTDRRDRQFLAVALIIGPILMIWMTARLLSRPLFRRTKEMGVALSQHGVHHTSWWGESRYEWSNIQSIRIHRGMSRSAFTHQPRDGFHLVITLDLTAYGKSAVRGGVPSSPISQWGPVMRSLTNINAAALDVYPPVVARVLTFYFEHPELREELGTEKALERVRTGNFIA